MKLTLIFLILLVPLLANAQLGSSTTAKKIDQINSNTGTDIILNPNDKVIMNYFTGSKALQSSATNEVEESAVTNTELGYVSGVTSGIQGQIDAKQDQLPLTTDGDILYYNAGFARLPIGTTAQVLAVSALGLPEWIDLPPSVSVTTKGDLQTYSTAPDRLPVGLDGQLLAADSAESTGLIWIDAPSTSPTTTIGDLIYNNTGSAAGDTRLPIGSDDQLLTVVSGEPAWADAPVSTTLTTKGDIQTYDTANARLPVGADGTFLVADSAETTGLKWSDTLSGTVNPVSDWQSFNLEIKATTTDPIEGGTPTKRAFYRTVGDELEVRVSYIQTTNGGSGSGTYYIDIPGGYQVDTNKFHNALNAGTGGAGWAAGFITGGNHDGHVLIDPILNRIYWYLGSDTNPINPASNTFFNLGQTTVRFSFFARVPVQGLSSGTSVVTQNTSLVKVHANNITGETSTASFAYNAVNNATEIEDTHNALSDTGNIIFTAPVDSYYDVEFGSRIDTSSSLTNFECGIFITSSVPGTPTNLAYNNENDSNSGVLANTFKCIFKDIKLNAGDVINEFYFRKGGTASITWQTDTRFNLLKISEHPKQKTIVGTFSENATKCQTKYLTADVTTNVADIADLRFTGLTNGKNYTIELRAVKQGTFTNLDNLIMFITGTGSVSGCGLAISSTAANMNPTNYVKCPVFTSTGANIVIGTSSITSGNLIAGNGTAGETYAVLCELPIAYSSTSEW